MATHKLAELLLRRKELQQKVDLLRHVDSKALYEVRAKRQAITDSVEEVVAQVPKLTASQVTAEYDFYARQLRLCDAAIQRANWETDVDTPDTVMGDYRAPSGE